MFWILRISIAIAVIRNIANSKLQQIRHTASAGGFAVVQHFALRLVLRREGHLPLKLATFLDYAAERIFLRKVGGGYVFVHRMLMDYFADLDSGRTALIRTK